LVDAYPATGKTVDKLVHYAVKDLASPLARDLSGLQRKTCPVSKERHPIVCQAPNEGLGQAGIVNKPH
jgi:hypothetical protein